jgi:hypothetical protein
MSTSQARHTLTWALELGADDHVVYTLHDNDPRAYPHQDAPPRQWGCVKDVDNTRLYVAHVGDDGQAQRVGMPRPPVERAFEFFKDIAAAKAWVEAGVIAGWRAYGLTTAPAR